MVPIGRSLISTSGRKRIEVFVCVILLTPLFYLFIDETSEFNGCNDSTVWSPDKALLIELANKDS